MLFLACSRCETRAASKTRDASCKPTKTTENRQQIKQLEKELANYEEDPNKSLEHLRERYVAFADAVGWKSNERQPLRVGSRHSVRIVTLSRGFDLSAQILWNCHEKEVRQLKSWSAQSFDLVKGLISRIPRAIIKWSRPKLPTSFKRPCFDLDGWEQE